MIRTYLCAAAVAATFSLSAPAFAHATFEVQEAVLGQAFTGVLRVPHGCDGEATHTVRIEIPEGLFNVKPMPKAGWTLETVTGAYANTYVNHGTEVTEGVREIVWSGGDLPDGWYDEFVFRGTFADTLAPGAFHIPAVQECANGVAAWTSMPGAETEDGPAPSVTLVAGDASGGHGGHDHGAVDAAGAMAGSARAGDLEISGAFTRATLPNAPVGGGYLTVTNTGEAADRLVAAASPAAGDVQIHEMSMVNDVMEMRKLEDGIEIPAGGAVTLAPGGLHLMFMQLNAPFEEGTQVPVTLTFENAGEVEVMLSVGGFGAVADPHAGHGGH
ncbi:copper chaperone PCu(A)C [Pelagibacterium xiamenense]|uniref:copper chaperone PCu(A)C n=1 Tax=Pelagibacterium xiamenense TaxID=2901140 RepID=UPI001E4C8468|nr:copper chaperone PCu(A)C [Pelagibacterium xiamenense]MCD7060204.1 copper chaperone PCu(A)C [Pelagibacterium xiamenense]